MKKAEWRVLPDVGEQYLERIGQEARLWHQFNGRSEYLKGRADELQERALLIEKEAVDKAVAEGNLTDFESLTHILDEGESHEIVRTHMAAAAMKRLTSLGEEPDLAQGGRAQLTVIKSGVRAKRFIIQQAPPTELLTDAPQLEVDEERVIEGALCTLHSRPELGGLIGFNTLWFATYYHGLVNPATGDPRVNLEVLARVDR